MKIAELIDSVKDANPKLLGKISDKKAAQIIAAALAQINLEVATSNGKVSVPRLGSFITKTTAQEKDGETHTVSRILFRAAKEKTKAAE